MLRKAFLVYIFCLIPALSAAQAPPSGPMARADREYVIAASANSPPYAYRGASGEPRGILIDFWRLWAEKNGVKVSFALTDWDETLALVRSGKADFHAGLFFTEERAETLDFAPGILDNTTSLFVLDRFPVSTIQDLRDIPVTVGVHREHSAIEVLRKQYPFIPLLVFPNNEAIFEAARKRRILGFAVDYPVAVFYLSRHDALGDFRLLGHLITRPLRPAVRKGNAALLGMISAGMKHITAEERERLLDSWGLRESPRVPVWVRRLLLAGIPAAIFLALALHWALLRREVRRKTLQLREKTDTLQKVNRDMARMARADLARLEQIERVSREKDNLLKLVAQGLRAPLQEVVALSGKPDRDHENAQRIQVRGGEMLRLMDRLLQLSRLERDAYRLQMRRVDLRKFLEDHRRVFQEMGSSRGIAVSMDLMPKPLKADIHPDHFEEICRNLLSNAVKFSHPGGTVRISLRPGTEEEKEAVLSISDTGIGIPERDIPGLFEKFRRTGPEESEETAVGMGLAIVKQLLDWHGGRIAVHSEEGEGTTFTVTLPVAPEYSLPYEDILLRLQTGDIILFNGNGIDPEMPSTAEIWTHVGLVVRIPTTGEPLLWESTPDETVEDRTLRMIKSGAQLVPLRDRLAAYATTVYSVRHLNAPREETMIRNLYRFIYEIHRLPFPSELQVVRRLVPARFFPRIFYRIGFLKNVFCSELVAESFIRMGLLPKSPPSTAYMPEDFSKKKKLPFLRGAYLGPEIRIDPPERLPVSAAAPAPAPASAP